MRDLVLVQGEDRVRNVICAEHVVRAASRALEADRLGHGLAVLPVGPRQMPRAVVVQRRGRVLRVEGEREVRIELEALRSRRRPRTPHALHEGAVEERLVVVRGEAEVHGAVLRHQVRGGEAPLSVTGVMSMVIFFFPSSATRMDLFVGAVPSHVELNDARMTPFASTLSAVLQRARQVPTARSVHPLRRGTRRASSSWGTRRTRCRPPAARGSTWPFATPSSPPITWCPRCSATRRSTKPSSRRSRKSGSPRSRCCRPARRARGAMSLKPIGVLHLRFTMLGAAMTLMPGKFARGNGLALPEPKYLKPVS